MTDTSGHINLRNSSVEQLQTIPELRNSQGPATVGDHSFAGSDTGALSVRVKGPFERFAANVSKKFSEMKFQCFERPSLRKDAVSKMMDLNPGLTKKGAEETIKRWTNDRIDQGMSPREAFKSVITKIDNLQNIKNDVAYVETEYPGLPKFDRIADLLMEQDTGLARERAVHFAAVAVVDQFQELQGRANIDEVLDATYRDTQYGNGDAPEWLVFGLADPDDVQLQQRRNEIVVSDIFAPHTVNSDRVRQPSIGVLENAELPDEMFDTPTRNRANSPLPRPLAPPPGLDVGRPQPSIASLETTDDPFPTLENIRRDSDPFPGLGMRAPVHDVDAIFRSGDMDIALFDRMTAELGQADVEIASVKSLETDSAPEV